jgi:excisionase family DNA binding protein
VHTSSRVPPPEGLTPLAYTVNEALTVVPMGRTALKALIASGALRSVKLGSRRIIPAEALHELLGNREVTS